MKKTTVLSFSSSFPQFDGDNMGIFILELSKRLQKKLNVVVLTPGIKASKKFETFDGVPVHRFKQFCIDGIEIANSGPIMSKLNKNKLYWLVIPFFLLRQLIALRKVVKSEKVDVIHSHWILPQGFTAVIYKTVFNPNIKLLLTIHGSDMNNFKSTMTKHLLKWILNHTDTIVTVSDALKKDVTKLGVQHNADVIPMGVDTRLFNPEKRDETLKEKLGISGSFILFVGRLIELKRIRLIIEAMPEVVTSLPETKLVVVGQGVLEQELKNRVRELKIDNNVIFMGNIRNNDLPAFYATADLFLLPSVSEGFPVAAMEALSSGTIMISSPIETVRKLIIENETGLYVHQVDKTTLAHKITEVLSNKEKFKTIPKKARQHIAQHYDWKIIGDKYAGLIAQMANKETGLRD